MGLGERLRTAREEKGLTIDEVASSTYIRAHHLAALENEEFHLVPTSRIRYFIKDYTRALGLEAEPFLAELPDDLSTPPTPTLATTTVSPSDGEQGEPEPVKPPVKKEKAKRARREKKEKRGERKTLVFGGAEGESAEGDREIRRRLGLRRQGPRYSPLEQGNPMLARIVIGIALLLVLALGAWYLFADDDEPRAIALVSDTVEGSPTRIITRDGEENGEATDSSESALPAGDSLVLRGTFIARAWYSVSVDGGNREEQGILDSGEVMEWRALESFSVDLGNAGGVRFSLNGKDIGTLGPMAGTVNDRVINAEGLQGGPTTTSSASGASSRRRRMPRRQPTTAPEQESPSPPTLERTAPRESLDEE